MTLVLLQQVPPSIKKSELLPPGWNSNSDIYALLYQPSDSNDSHLLKIIVADGSLLVHILVRLYICTITLIQFSKLYLHVFIYFYFSFLFIYFFECLSRTSLAGCGLILPLEVALCTGFTEA